MECGPISSGAKPSLLFPMTAAAAHNLVLILNEVISLREPLFSNVLTFESSEVFRYDLTLASNDSGPSFDWAH